MYARVSSAEHTENLERQVERLVEYCMVRGYQDRLRRVKEIASGVSDSRTKLFELLPRSAGQPDCCEHRDRLTHFGFRYLETL